MTPIAVPLSFLDVLGDLILAACVLIIVGCAISFLLFVLGWNRKRPRVESRADLGSVSGQWLDERGRNRRPE